LVAGSRPDQIHRLIVSSDLPACLAACLTVSCCAAIMYAYYYNDYYYVIRLCSAPRDAAFPRSSSR